jgi:hypothetical protein
LKGALSVYNDQWVMGELTLGRLNRVFLEEVEGVWQGAVFLHSGGHDAEGKKGFTAGPNRIVRGPDEQFYLGHIGDGGLWRFLPKPGEEPKPPYGLQRLSFVANNEIPADFNEMVAIRDMPGGLEIELFKAIDPSQLEKVRFETKQWTYVPTNGYGGRNFGEETLKITGRELSKDGKRIRLTLPGIRDNSPPFVTDKNYSNENVGWVIEVALKNLPLYKDTGWYTMIRHQGGGSTQVVSDSLSVEKEPMKYAEAQFKAICAACHTLDGNRLAGPSFKGLFGKRQTVIRDGRKVEVTVDDAYLLRAIATPLAEAPEGYPPAMPALSLSLEEQGALVNWIKAQK